MGKALKACPASAPEIAEQISKITGKKLSTDALYTYTAPSKDHDISITRFVAFVRATGAFWLWDLLVEDDGLIVLNDREAKLAQLGYLEQERMRLDKELHELRHELSEQPVRVMQRTPPSKGARR